MSIKKDEGGTFLASSSFILEILQISSETSKIPFQKQMD